MQAKFEGGLGVGVLRSKNNALLGKWWWHWLFDRNKMWQKLILELYGKENSHSWGALKGNSNLSPVLRGIVNLSRNQQMDSLINHTNFKWDFKDGQTILFWHDWWHERGH